MDCDIFVACVSPAYDKSENCMAEMRMARDDMKTIIPVLVKDFKIQKTEKLRKGFSWFHVSVLSFVCKLFDCDVIAVRLIRQRLLVRHLYTFNYV